MGIFGTDDFCLVARPISVSVNDTQQTINAVQQHNALYRKLCVDE